ncbi:PREDICTED: dipeptidyl peptidase 3 [Thamnophis sirtalis]|uniref:Dipeptidyl peptidase 3 n=1 Tax=Thamnophis sirtalis TaxID=35019 RepID=A0A6I9YTL0_9SAUR|nr:PREDICTED: dipeptidyl peptidase 3 [Thamnophis sirtalis]
MVDSHYVLPNDIGIATLDCAEAFELLSAEEKFYAHYLSRACWYGGLVVLLQTSPESPTIYVLLSRIFRTQDPNQLQEVARSLGVTDEEYQALLVYTAAIYANMGNYKSFGDTKFVPSLPKEKLKKLVWASQAFLQNPEEMEALWESCEKLMYSLEPLQRHLGLRGEGVSTYFSANCSMEDAKLAQKFLDSQNISAYNTRLFKTETGGKTSYEVRLASVLLDEPQLDEMKVKTKQFQFEGCTFTVTRGDYSPILQRVVENLQKAQQHTARPVQTEMLEHYATSFRQGSIPSHKEGSRCWIRDKSPIVERCLDATSDDSGAFNFDKSAVINPETGELIRSWYQGGETWDSKFSSVASSYEECRAECVGLYLCLNKDVLRIFELKGEDAENVIYINWLNMVRAGLLALEFYTPESGSWRQAHMQARFVILRVLLEAGEGLVSLHHTTGMDGKPDAAVLLDRTKITSVGKPALESFLRKLQILKSTADVEGGRKLYEAYSAVTDDKPERFLSLRKTVLLRKEARKLFVQANTRLEGGKVRLTQYESSAGGLIRSFSERFSEDADILERELLELTHADAHFWQS